MTSFVYSVKDKKWYKYSDGLLSYGDLLSLSNTLGSILLMQLREVATRELQEERLRRAAYEQKMREEAEKRRFESKDPYTVLGIARGSSRAEVRRAYMCLARAHHPDIFSDPVEKSAADERMKRINGAKDTLLSILSK